MAMGSPDRVSGRDPTAQGLRSQNPCVTRARVRTRGRLFLGRCGSKREPRVPPLRPRLRHPRSTTGPCLHCPPAKFGLFVDADTESDTRLCPRRLSLSHRNTSTEQRGYPAMSAEQSSRAGREFQIEAWATTWPLSPFANPLPHQTGLPCLVLAKSRAVNSWGRPSLLSTVAARGRSFAAVLFPVIPTLRCRGYDARCLLPRARLG